MTDKVRFQFLTLKAEAEGIRAVRVVAILTFAALLTSIALAAIWVSR